jgi:hypothetical protein
MLVQDLDPPELFSVMQDIFKNVAVPMFLIFPQLGVFENDGAEFLGDFPGIVGSALVEGARPQRNVCGRKSHTDQQADRESYQPQAVGKGFP